MPWDELLFTIPADEHAQQTLSELPLPGTDTSALGAPVGPEPASCIGPADPALLAILADRAQWPGNEAHSRDLLPTARRPA